VKSAAVRLRVVIILPRPVRSHVRACLAVLSAGLLLVSLEGVSAEAKTSAAFALSGEQRSRYETTDEDYRADSNAGNHGVALRTTVAFRYERERFGAHAELMDARIVLNRSVPLNRTMVNTLEPIQAYLFWSPGVNPERVDEFRIGRMTMDLGKRRVIARSAFRNDVNSFTGIDWERQTRSGRRLRAFYVAPMVILPRQYDTLLDNEQAFDHMARDTRLLGIDYQSAPLNSGVVVEIYGLSLRSQDVDLLALQDLEVATLGVRAFRPAMAGRWHYEVEAIAQRGTSSALTGPGPRSDRSSRFTHLEVGYRFGGTWSADLMIQYDYASGDRDPTDDRDESFNTLFGARRFDYGPTGTFGPFARTNLETPGVRATLAPNGRTQVMAAYRAYALASNTDAWLAAGIRDVSGRSGGSLGRQLEASVIWAALPGRLDLESGFAHLDKGRFAREAPRANPAGHSTYFYAALSVHFDR
jgi:Alginate export